MRDQTFIQGIVNETLMDNLVKINTKYHDHECGFDDKDGDLIRDMPGFGYYIKRKRKY